MSDELSQLGDYSRQGLAAAEAALFAAWEALEKFHEDLVVVWLAVALELKEAEDQPHCVVRRKWNCSARVIFHCLVRCAARDEPNWCEPQLHQGYWLGSASARLRHLRQ